MEKWFAVALLILFQSFAQAHQDEDREFRKYTDTVLSNVLGQPVRPRDRIKTLDALEQADHIAFPRGAYWHHAIVENVAYGTGDVTVIEYDGPFPQNGAKAVIKRRTFGFKEEKKIYRLRYAQNESCLKGEVIRKAISRLGEEEYNLFNNNCEHFATWAKSNKRTSEQTQRFYENVEKHTLNNLWKLISKKMAMSTVNLKTLLEVNKLVKRAGLNALDDVWRMTLSHLLSRDVSSYTSVDIEKLLNVLDLDKIPLLNSGTLQKALPWVNLVLDVGFETIHLLSDYARYQDAYNRGTLSDEELREVIVKRVFSAILAVIGSQVGYYGGMVGGTMVCGPGCGLVGAHVGSTAGNLVGSALGGPVGGAALWFYDDILVEAAKLVEDCFKAQASDKMHSPFMDEKLVVGNLINSAGRVAGMTIS